MAGRVQPGQAASRRASSNAGFPNGRARGSSPSGARRISNENGAGQQLAVDKQPHVAPSYAAAGARFAKNSQYMPRPASSAPSSATGGYPVAASGGYSQQPRNGRMTPSLQGPRQVEMLLERVAELEQAMTSMQDDNSSLREQVQSLQTEAEKHQAEKQHLNQKMQVLTSRSPGSPSTKSTTRRSLFGGRSNMIDAGPSNQQLLQSTHASTGSTLAGSSPATAKTSPNSPRGPPSERPSSPRSAHGDVPLTGGHIENVGQPRGSISKEPRFEGQIPNGMGAKFHLAHADESTTEVRSPRDQRSYTSRIHAENTQRHAMATHNVKLLEACLQDHDVGTPDDTQRFLQVHSSYVERTRRDLVRKAMSASEHARCKIDQVLAYDRSGLPTCGKWSNRAGRIEAFIQAVQQGEAAIHLCEEAEISCDQLRHTLEDVKANLITDAKIALEEASKSGSLKALKGAVAEANAVGVPARNAHRKTCESMLQTAESLLSTEPTDAHLDSGDKVLLAIKERIDNMKMKVVHFFQAYDTDKSGFIDSDELNEALNKMGLQLTEPALEALMLKLDKDGNGNVSVKEFARCLARTEKLRDKARSGPGGGSKFGRPRSPRAVSPRPRSPRTTSPKSRSFDGDWIE